MRSLKKMCALASLFLSTALLHGAGIITPTNEDEYLDTATISVMVDTDGSQPHRIR